MPTVNIALNDTQALHVAHVVRVLHNSGALDGAPVVFAYVKANGSVSQRTGTVVRMMGTPGQSSHSVRVDTPDGERTFSLTGISGMRAVWQGSAVSA